MAISPKDELLLTQGAQYTDLVDWALKTEDNATLQGEVQYFRAYHSKACQIAHRIGALKESLQNERLAMYQSSDRLAAANAITCILVVSTTICTHPPTSRAREAAKPKSPFAIRPSTHGARTVAKCATGAEGLAIALKIATVSDIAVIAHAIAMMALIVFVPMTSVMSSKTVRSTPLTPTLNVATVPLLTTTLTSKGH